MSTAKLPRTKVMNGNMDSRAICRWLQLPDATWPPDHYTLLGLTQGESNIDKIEEQAQERMATVRCYQLSHPELATEALNRLAEAYACLTTSSMKHQYDAGLGIVLGHQPTFDSDSQKKTMRGQGDTIPSGVRAIVYDSSQEPPRRRKQVRSADVETQEMPAIPPMEVGPSELSAKSDIELPVGHSQAEKATVLPSLPADPVLESARYSRTALRGIATRRGLYERVLLTRKLRRLWQRAGSVLGDAKRKVTRPSEGHALLKNLWALEALLEEFPGFVGRPGKPGYRVAILARDEKPLKALHQMDKAERELLKQDWRTGLTLIQSHLSFLREVVAQRKRKSWLKDTSRVVRAWMGEHRPILTVLAGIALFASVLLLTWFLQL
ncbi:MAG: hypothetical protein ACFCD0_05995 [Gemmataceae bacterium]